MSPSVYRKYSDADVRERLDRGLPLREQVEAVSEWVCPELLVVVRSALDAGVLTQVESWPFSLCFNVTDPRWLKTHLGELHWEKHEPNMHDRWAAEVSCPLHTGPGIIGWP